MFERPWSKPIHLVFPKQGARTIAGPLEALDVLNADWPASTGHHYQAAKASCQAALGRTMPAEVAREIFISASIEAAVPFH